MSEYKTIHYICTSCFTQIDMKYPVSAKLEGDIEDCPMCGDELIVLSNEANVSNVKYHLEKLEEYLKSD